MAILLPCPYQIVIIKDEDGKEEKKFLFDNALLVRFSEETGAFADVAGSIYGLFQNLVSCDGALGILISFAPITNTMESSVTTLKISWRCKRLSGLPFWAQNLIRRALFSGYGYSICLAVARAISPP